MLEKFIKFLTYEKRYSQHTVIAYQTDLLQLQSFLSETFEIDSPEEVKHVHLRSWIVDLMEYGNSSKSINRKIASVKSFYKFLQGREAIQKNPALKLKPLKTDRQLPAFVKEHDINALLERIEFQGDFAGKRDQLMLELLYGTGIRLAELMSLQEKDLNTADNTIKVLGKRNKERVIPISQFIVRLIKEYQLLKSEIWGSPGEAQYLLLTDQGKKLYPMFVYRKVKQYLSMVTSLSKRSPHVLRHTFATHLLDKGADLNAVKDLLGHSSLAATQVYTHNTLEKLKSVFEQAHPKA
jgi:integrase/recombinase XerC